MSENHNEITLLSLMLNKNEFLRYLTQQFKNYEFYIPLKPLIWAIHFNIPKYQRLPLLENILLQNMAYIRTCYSFLPEKQIHGKTYEILGIPTICGEPNKYFLNAYKKYKSYYPIKYPKSEKLLELFDSIHKSIEIKTDPNYSSKYSTPTKISQEIISSTPINRKKINFEINQISPIKKLTMDKNETLLSNSFYDQDNSSNLLNISKNSIDYNNEQVLLLSSTLQTSNSNIFNNSLLIHYNVQNVDNIKTRHFNNIQRQQYYENRNATFDQTINDTSQSNTLENIYKREVKKDIDSAIINLDIKKQIKHKKLKCKKSLTSNKKGKLVLKQNKTKNKSSVYHMGNNLQMKKIGVNIKTPKLNKIQISHSLSDLNESWTSITNTFSDKSFSNFNKKAQTLLTINNDLNEHNQIEHDLSNLSYNNKQEKIEYNWSISNKLQSNKSWESISFSENSFSKDLLYLNRNNKFNKMYLTSSLIPSDECFSD